LGWTKCFGENTEVKFLKKDGGITDRQADAIIDNKYVIEFQHSEIKQSEVKNRKKDYG
jgi:competence CoiA-like predicted nuclease